MTIMKARARAADADGGADDGGADGGVQPLLTAPAVVNGLLASGGFVYYTSGPSTLQASRPRAARR